jgi:hypothetical protein
VEYTLRAFLHNGDTIKLQNAHSGPTLKQRQSLKPKWLDGQLTVSSYALDWSSRTNPLVFRKQLTYNTNVSKPEDTFQVYMVKFPVDGRNMDIELGICGQGNADLPTPEVPGGVTYFEKVGIEL